MIKLLLSTLAATALALPQAAMADVTYAFTGATFNNVTVQTWLDDDAPPGSEEAESAAAKAILLTDHIGITLTTPVYIPAGWSIVSYVGVIGEPGGPLAALQPSYPGAGVDWTLTNTAFNTGGHIVQDNIISFDPWLESRLTVSLHVSAGNVVDAWEITVLPSEAYGAPNWDIRVSSSSISGDTLLHEFGAAHFAQRKEAATTEIGVWTVSGSPVAPVPEPASYALLLAGLATIGTLARRRRA